VVDATTETDPSWRPAGAADVMAACEVARGEDPPLSVEGR
jgi:hypothetical protein